MKKYSYQATLTLQYAEKAAKFCNTMIDSGHLLYGISETDGIAGKLVRSYRLTPAICETYLIKSSNAGSPGRILISPIAHAILRRAEKLSKDSIGAEDILMAICLERDCHAAKILRDHGLTEVLAAESLRLQPCETIQQTKAVEQISQYVSSDRSEPNLPDYSIELTIKAEKGELPTVIERDAEAERVIQVLTRKRKHNVLLVGDNGVGKTAIVHLLAQKIVKKQVPTILINKRILCIRATAFTAGTKYRGDLEEKAEQLLALASARNDILFFDDVRSALTTGGSENNNSFVDVLLSATDLDTVSSVCAISHTDYSYLFQKCPALIRRFTKIDVKEPDIQTTERILLRLLPEYEQHYGVTFRPDVVETVVRYAEKYSTDRRMPDKAIDLLDETCSQVVGQQKNVISADDVKKALAESTGIPIVTQDADRTKILELENKLNQVVVGQADAIHTVVQAILRTRAGLSRKNKPIGTFVFLGKTGVGKTETAKALCRELFGRESALIRFDMSEYMEKASAAKLIGSPPGYVGHEEGGLLTEQVRKAPYSVVLFDEIEKAHPDIFDLFLQITDEGALTDSRGYRVDFRNTILIMTGNVGTNEITKQKNVGFGESAKRDDAQIQIDAFKRLMRPEFINRIDEIIVFHPLDKESIKQIADSIIREKKDFLWKERGIRLLSDDSVASFIADHAYSDEYGARPIQRAVETLIENKVSEKILADNVKNAEITMTVQNDEIVLSVKQ